MITRVGPPNKPNISQGQFLFFSCHVQFWIAPVIRLQVVPHFSSAWGDFHARSRFARSTIPEEKWGTARSLPVVNIAKISV